MQDGSLSLVDIFVGTQGKASWSSEAFYDVIRADQETIGSIGSTHEIVF